jgi:Cys-rich repeat protein
MTRTRLLLPLLLLTVAATPALAAPVDSDLAIAANGGGCRPTGITPSILDMLTLINPEWAPIVNGGTVSSTPITIHGVVQDMHGELSGDFPATHLRADVNEFLLLDAADSDRLATGNDDGLGHLEWEAGVYPAWAWAGVGDRVVAMGRWIFDCGHTGAAPGSCSVSTSRSCVLDGDCQPPLCPSCGTTETCVGTHYGYSSELHPPQATATIRAGRGGIVSLRPGTHPVPVTRADIFVSAEGGGAGDECILTHRATDLSLLTSTECFPLSQPVAPMNAQDFVFDLPFPPKPLRGRLAWRITNYPPPGGVAPRVMLKRDRALPDLFHVIVRMTRLTRGKLPTGYAGTIEVGWRNDPTPLNHVRVTLDSIHVNNALQPTTPSIPRTCSVSDTPCATNADCPSGQSCFGRGPVKSWRMQAFVNGQAQELVGLDSVSTGDTIPQGLVFDQYLVASDAVNLQANGRSHECIDSMYGTSLATGLAQLGFTKGVLCLATNARNPGAIDLTYGGPDFGAGTGGSMTYAAVSTGGVGGLCSVTTGTLCTVNQDCPSGETCTVTGGAFTLNYHIERLP